jgi:MoaA/NifB/PqqE/SkfB family radical SAM enzyme
LITGSVLKVKHSRTKQFFYLAAYLIKSRIIKKYRKPLICSFKLTNNCNLRCRHCPFWKIKNPESLSFRKIKEILYRIHRDGIRIVIFEGGEPALWKDGKAKKDITDIVRYSKELFFSIGLTTNGTIDLKNLDPDIIFVSIDGLEKTHDSIRGKSFSKIIKNIDKYKDSKKIIANICISSINYNEIIELVKFLNDRVYGITIQFFYPFDGIEDLRVRSDRKEILLKKLLSLKQKGYKLLDSEACLKNMVYNTWTCHDFLVSSVEPDGRTTYGCYLKNKVTNVLCEDCGFAVHCEISYAYRINMGALKTASRIFWG